MSVADIVRRLEALRDPAAAEGMARYGITGKTVYGVPIPNLRALAQELGRNHNLAAELWAINSRETRILAAMVDDPQLVDEYQMDRWVADFDSWEVCDQVCMNLFDRTPHAWSKAVEWAGRSREFEKRAGFALIACLAWHDKRAADEQFLAFLPVIATHGPDNRNFVKKAASWALRHIGKRNTRLRLAALQTAEAMCSSPSPGARWVAADAIRELNSPAVVSRLRDAP